MKITKPVILSSYRPKADGSASLTFTTSLEVTPSDIAEIHSLLNTHGILYYRGEETMNKDEIKELDEIDLDIYDEPKSQSQRLRNVLYKLHQQEGIGEFKDYYKQQTEKIIEHFKGKLDG